LAKGGKTAQARKTLNDIVSLYAGDKDLQPIVGKARQHLSTLNEPSAIETNRN
jgi:hypothetical protein